MRFKNEICNFFIFAVFKFKHSVKTMKQSWFIYNIVNIYSCLKKICKLLLSKSVKVRNKKQKQKMYCCESLTDFQVGKTFLFKEV